MRRALIIGVTGQDGQYLAELLAAKGYQVFGLVRGQFNPKAGLIKKLVPSIRLLSGDLLDFSSLVNALAAAQPDEVYNLAALHHVSSYFEQPTLTSEITGMGVLRLLEAIRHYAAGETRKIRFCQASSCEMFAGSGEVPQREMTPICPRSPYGAAKAFGHHMTRTYRESYGAWACAGILFHHESPRSSHEFVARKVTQAVARIVLGLQNTLTVDDLEARREWGFAGDYVEALWLMMQRKMPSDYIIATGQTHSVRDLLNVAFRVAGIAEWEPYVRQHPLLKEPVGTELPVGDPAKAHRELGWSAHMGFDDLIALMVESDLAIESARCYSGRSAGDSGPGLRVAHHPVAAGLGKEPG